MQSYEEDSTTSDSSGVKTIHEQKPNKPLSRKKICKLSYKIPDLKTYEHKNGQILWVSTGVIDLKHVKSVINLYKELGRSLHFNIGTHGSEDGKIVGPKNPDYGISTFMKQIIKEVEKGNQFSIHIVSSHSGPIYPDEIDIFHSWCYSEQYYFKNYSQNSKEVKIPESWENYYISQEAIPEQDYDQEDIKPCRKKIQSNSNDISSKLNPITHLPLYDYYVLEAMEEQKPCQRIRTSKKVRFT